MIKIPMTKQYHENAEKSKGEPCCICGKEVKNPRWGLVTAYGSHALEPGETVSEEDDTGLYLVGPECKRKHPDLPYVDVDLVSVR